MLNCLVNICQQVVNVKSDSEPPDVYRAGQEGDEIYRPGNSMAIRSNPEFTSAMNMPETQVLETAVSTADISWLPGRYEYLEIGKVLCEMVALEEEAARIVIYRQDSEVSAMDSWSQSHIDRAESRGWISRFITGAGIAFTVWILAASPLTSIPNQWSQQQQPWLFASRMLAHNSEIGRPISRTEALRIARQVLMDAENARMQVAEYEAARGIQWE